MAKVKTWIASAALVGGAGGGGADATSRSRACPSVLGKAPGPMSPAKSRGSSSSATRSCVGLDVQSPNAVMSPTSASDV